MKILVDGREVELSEETRKKVEEEVNEYYDKFFYHSSSKGKILLVTMSDEHLKNALLKKLREVIDNAKELTASEIATALSSMRPFLDEKEDFGKLASELISRYVPDRVSIVD